MNPEFRRNLWLELTPRRMATAAILLALAFFAAALSGGSAWRPASVASFIYYVVVVLWGSRNAALSVVGEIRDRTWDAQRLSSLSAAEMTWGKLFGSTIFNWYVGGICLVLMLAQQVVQAGIVTALIDLVYFLEIGIIAQAAALLASLIAVQRRQAHGEGAALVAQDLPPAARACGLPPGVARPGYGARPCDDQDARAAVAKGVGHGHFGVGGHAYALSHAGANQRLLQRQSLRLAAGAGQSAAERVDDLLAGRLRGAARERGE